MGIGIVIMGVLLFVSVLRLWSYDRQLKEWAEQLTQTDEYSNLRLGTSVRSRAFLNCCRAVNERLERGQQARIRQESMSRELKFTISCVSHDIRTPLTAIKAYAEGVRDGIAPTEEQQKRYMGIILKRANDLDSMLEELFLITTLNYKKESRPSEKIELGKYVQGFVEDHIEHYKSRGLELSQRVTVKDATIMANPQLLQRVLQKIFNNSAKYKMADIGHSVIDVTEDESHVYCVVSDDGPGVPPESLDRLMRPFYRVDSSRTNPQEGSGLGLSIIRRIMEIFEGRVVIENIRPHGLRIILEFPKKGENHE